ncbi:DUF2637 domain-containing protein [Streptomyces sp. R08]|uniref:DUF2637 domain-containing protein n=1 Tax=Streptomyces sp. R08 TaxID=3238624 RepID=A0AB39MBV0_9ACTN
MHWGGASTSEDTGSKEGSAERRTFDLDLWVRPLCALVVAGAAAYASYVHQRQFALQGGADRAGASLWPLSVDGLLLLATVGLLNPVAPRASSKSHDVVRLPLGDRRVAGRKRCGSSGFGVEAGAGCGMATSCAAAAGGSSRGR